MKSVVETRLEKRNLSPVNNMVFAQTCHMFTFYSQWISTSPSWAVSKLSQKASTVASNCRNVNRSLFTACSE